MSAYYPKVIILTEIVPEVVTKFNDFLVDFRNYDNRAIYCDQIDNFIEHKRTSFYIDIEHLLSYGFTDEVVELFSIDKAENTIYSFERAFAEILNEKDRSFLRTIKHNYHIRLFNAPSYYTKKLRYIGANEVGYLVASDGIVTKVYKKDAFFETASFKCYSCQEITNWKFSDDEFSKPVVCVRYDEDGSLCMGKTFKLLKKESKLVEFQKIVIQENPEDLEQGEVPNSFVVWLKDDLVGQVKAGNRITLLAYVRTRANKRLTVGSIPIHDYYLEAHYIKKEEESEAYVISEEDEKEILLLIQNPKIFDLLVQSICPEIFGLINEKRALILAVIGGTEKGIEHRCQIHILFIGDPSTGKSKLLRYVSQFIPRKAITNGRGSTAAGLTAAVLKEGDEFVLEAGAVVLADRGICFIDEFDKMTVNDASALHESMADRTVTIAKAGIQAILNARTTIIAAANPLGSKWRKDIPPMQNLKLRQTIISRFDLIFPIVDEYNEEKDTAIAKTIIQKNKENPEFDRPIRKELLKKYFAYTKSFKSYLSHEAENRLTEFYLSIKKGSSEDRIAIAPRQLEGLIRLTEARAKLSLRNIATIEDANEVITIFKNYYDRIAKGEEGYDVGQASGGQPSSKRRMSDLIFGIIKDLCEKNDTGCSTNMILEELKKMDIEMDFDKLDSEYLESFRREGDVYSPRTNYYKIP